MGSFRQVRLNGFEDGQVEGGQAAEAGERGAPGRQGEGGVLAE